MSELSKEELARRTRFFEALPAAMRAAGFPSWLEYVDALLSVAAQTAKLNGAELVNVQRTLARHWSNDADFVVRVVTGTDGGRNWHLFRPPQITVSVACTRCRQFERTVDVDRANRTSSTQAQLFEEAKARLRVEFEKHVPECSPRTARRHLECAPVFYTAEEW